MDEKQGTNEVKSDMSIFNIPSEDLNTVIGRTKDKNGTSWVGENTRAPYVTVIGESEDGLTGQPVYVALLKGTFSLDSIEFKTRGEKAEAPEPTKLTGDWMNRKVDVDGTSQGIVYGYHEGKEGEAEFFKKYSLDTRTVKIIQRILQVRYPANPQNVEVAVNSKSATVSAE